MRVLVAGGAGFIGSNLCEALLDRGHYVTCVDNFSSGRRRNIAALESRRAFDLIEADVLDPRVMYPSAQWIFHLASPASPPAYVKRPVDTLRANSEGTLRLLEHARDCQAKFLFASTSEAYGDPLVHPQSEEYRGNVSSTGPRSMYDEGKRYGEAMTMAFVRSHAVDARVVRIFNTYGPNSGPDDGRLVPNFMVQALGGRPLTVYGDGSQTRSLCYVEDLIRGLILAMEQPATRGEVINLGNPDERTILEFANIIIRIVASKSEITFRHQEVGDDPRMRSPDITKARRLLNWEPTVPLLDGLEATARYFRELGATVP